MDRIRAMQIFVAVARERNFAAAAKKLNLSPAAVTRSISALEDYLGTRLLTRSTRKVNLTDAGSAYFEDSEAILESVDRAEATAAGAQTIPSGTLNITASVMFGRMYIAPMLTEFLDQYPDINAGLTLLDRMTNMLEEGFDVGVRIGQLPDSGLVATRVGSVRHVVVAAPAYLNKKGMPQNPGELINHQIISVSGSFCADVWKFGIDGDETVEIRPRLFTNNNAAAVAMAKSGWGITRLLSYQVGPALTAGELRIILSDWEAEPLPVHIVHNEGRTASAKVRAFIDFARDRLRADPMLNHK